MGSRSSPFDRLTDDVVLRVFSFLPSAQLALCGRVSRRWHVLAWEPQLWSTIVLSGDNVPADRALKVLSPAIKNQIRRVGGGIVHVLNTFYLIEIIGLQRLLNKKKVKKTRKKNSTHNKNDGCNLSCNNNTKEFVMHPLNYTSSRHPPPSLSHFSLSTIPEVRSCTHCCSWPCCIMRDVCTPSDVYVRSRIHEVSRSGNARLVPLPFHACNISLSVTPYLKVSAL